MSSINTNSLDVNYPIPGQNNTTQGFRNNFTNIKTNLDTAGNEITDLQNKVVLKSALANSVLNNDMANTVIANAATLQFRATTYNLGNALVGNVAINCSLGDVQTGTVAGNITLNFSSWAPTNTEGHVSLKLNRANANVDAYIFLPNTITNSELLENFVVTGQGPAITFPYNSTQMALTLTTTDCGNSLNIEPTSRPFKSTSIQYGEPPSTGRLGDTNGTIYMPNSVSQLQITTTYANDFIVTSSTSSLYVGQPVAFTAGEAGVSTEANITLGTTYYVSNIGNTTAFKVSANANTSGNVDLAGNVANMFLNPISYIYVAVDDYSANAVNRNITSTTSPNIITLSGSTANIVANYPIIFTETVNANANTCGLVTNTVYYIKSVSGSNITVSMTRNNGVAGPEYQGITTVASADVDIDYTVYDGPDIFRRIPLQPF
jgi:hypothetical protein